MGTCETPETLDAAADALFRQQRPAFSPAPMKPAGELVAERPGANGYVLEARRLLADNRAPRRPRHVRWKFCVVAIDPSGVRHETGSCLTVSAMSLAALAGVVSAAMRHEIAALAQGEDAGWHPLERARFRDALTPGWTSGDGVRKREATEP